VNTKEGRVYNLVLVKSGKMRLSDDQSQDPSSELSRQVPLLVPKPQGQNEWIFSGTAIRIAGLVNFAQQFQDGPVIDKTGLKGFYDIHLELQATLGPGAAPEAMRDFSLQVLEELGLKLIPAKGPVEILVIDHAEKPSEN
jgi:uncharacterized protein (TIGR03435 family)